MEDSEHYFVIEPKGKFNLDLRELVDHGELLYFFAWRDIKVKYKQTVLGLLWAILQPVLLMLIFSLFIGRSFKTSVEGMTYPIFVFSGLGLWLLFSSGITGAGNSMISNAQIIKKIYFPRLIIPISSVLVSAFDFVIAFFVFIPMLFLYRQPVDLVSALWTWPLAIILTIIGTFGPGCLLAALNVKYRDFRYVIPFLVQALLFVTPVIYPVSIVGNKWLQYVMAINPAFAPITIFRIPLHGAALDWELISISVISGLVFLVLGVGYFRRTEKYFADLT